MMIPYFQLTAPIAFDSYRQPIKLASRSSYVGRPASIAGWGYLSANIKVSPEYLQKMSSTIQDISYCKSQITDVVLYTTHVCTMQSYGLGVCKVSCFLYYNYYYYRGGWYKLNSNTFVDNANFLII